MEGWSAGLPGMARRLLVQGGVGGPETSWTPRLPSGRAQGSRGYRRGWGCSALCKGRTWRSSHPSHGPLAREAVHVSWAWCEGLRGSWPAAALAVGPALPSASSGPPGGRAISRLVFGALRRRLPQLLMPLKAGTHVLLLTVANVRATCVPLPPDAPSPSQVPGCW